MCVIYNFRVCVRFRVLQVRSCQDVERIVALLLEVFDVIVQKPHQLRICVVLEHGDDFVSAANSQFPDAFVKAAAEVFPALGMGIVGVQEVVPRANALASWGVGRGCPLWC